MTLNSKLYVIQLIIYLISLVVVSWCISASKLCRQSKAPKQFFDRTNFSKCCYIHLETADRAGGGRIHHSFSSSQWTFQNVAIYNLKHNSFFRFAMRHLPEDHGILKKFLYLCNCHPFHSTGFGNIVKFPDTCRYNINATGKILYRPSL